MRFLVINSDTNNVVEEHNDKHLADKACSIVNTHEINHDRLPIYYVQPTCPNCNSDEMERVDPMREDWLCLSCHYVLHLKGK